MASPLNATKFAAQTLYRIENSSNGSSGGAPPRFRLLDQQARSFLSRLAFRCGIPFNMDERRYERDLKIDLFVK